MLAEPLQDELVVQQAVERSQEEDVEGQVANPLLLKVPTQSLHLPDGPEDRRRSKANEANVSQQLSVRALHRAPTYRPVPVQPGTLNVSGDELSAAAGCKKEKSQ